MPDTRWLALPNKRTLRGNPRAGGVPRVGPQDGPRVVRRASSDTVEALTRRATWKYNNGGRPRSTGRCGRLLASGELVTLVIEDERFFGYRVCGSRPEVACVAIQFKQGAQRVRNTFRWKISSGSAIVTSASGITHAPGARSAVAARDRGG
jgi:hypothetical protein